MVMTLDNVSKTLLDQLGEIRTQSVGEYEKTFKSKKEYEISELGCKVIVKLTTVCGKEPPKGVALCSKLGQDFIKVTIVPENKDVANAFEKSIMDFDRLFNKAVINGKTIK